MKSRPLGVVCACILSLGIIKSAAAVVYIQGETNFFFTDNSPLITTTCAGDCPDKNWATPALLEAENRADTYWVASFFNPAGLPLRGWDSSASVLTYASMLDQRLVIDSSTGPTGQVTDVNGVTNAYSLTASARADINDTLDFAPGDTGSVAFSYRYQAQLGLGTLGFDDWRDPVTNPFGLNLATLTLTVSNGVRTFHDEHNFTGDQVDQLNTFVIPLNSNQANDITISASISSNSRKLAAVSQQLDFAISSPVSYTTASGVQYRSTLVPLPASVWLFGSGLLGLIGIARRKKA